MKARSKPQAVARAASAIALAAILCCTLPSPAHAAIGVRAASPAQTTAAGAASIAVSVPAGTAAGDVMIASINTGPGIVTLTPPAGWTAITNTTPPWSATAKSLTYYRVATAAEPASYSWSFGAAVGAAGDIVSYTGVDDTNPVGPSATASSGGAVGSMATPTVTTTAANSWVIADAAWRRNAGAGAPTITKDAATTQRSAAVTTAGPQWVGVMTTDVAQAAAGLSTARTFTSSATAQWVTQTIALKPSSGTLSFSTAPDLPNLAGLTLTGASQTVNATMANFAIDEESATKSGWNVTVNGNSGVGKSAVFARYCPNAGGCGADALGYPGGGASLAASSMSLNSTGASATGGLGNAPTFQCGSSCAVDVASGSPTKVLSAAAGQGFATWTTSGFGATSVALSAPTTVRALPASEVYRIDLLWTLGTGP
jgi:hypothetical protein